MLGLEPSADADAIKKAFRREIARYHPDKVIHLGAEFQEMAATRARVHSGKSPLVVLLFARVIAPQQEISKATDSGIRMPKPPGGPEEVAVVVVDTADWSCRLPPNSSKEVRKLADTLCEK